MNWSAHFSYGAEFLLGVSWKRLPGERRKDGMVRASRGAVYRASVGANSPVAI